MALSIQPRAVAYRQAGQVEQPCDGADAAGGVSNEDNWATYCTVNHPGFRRRNRHPPAHAVADGCIVVAV